MEIFGVLAELTLMLTIKLKVAAVAINSPFPAVVAVTEKCNGYCF